MQHVPLAFEGAQAVGEVFDGLGASIQLFAALVLRGLFGSSFSSRLGLSDFRNAFTLGLQRLNGSYGLEISFWSFVEVVGKHFVSHAVSPSSR